MPSPRVHAYVDRMLFGKAYWRVHREMDKPVKILGRLHRRVFHDPLSAIAIAEREYPGDPLAVRAALHHIWLDNICSWDPEFRELLEAAERLSRRKRRRRRKTASHIQPISIEFY